MLIVDTGVLLASADIGDPDHLACRDLVASEPGPFVTSALVVAEAVYLIDRQLGPLAESRFVRSIADGALVVADLGPSDWLRIAGLVEQYADLPLGTTDASLVVLVERFHQTRLATLDRRHFTVVRPAMDGALQLLPH